MKNDKTVHYFEEDSNYITYPTNRSERLNTNQLTEHVRQDGVEFSVCSSKV